MAEILLIDDEPDIRATVAYNLKKEGHRVREAGSGEAGLAQARRESPPDLILLDLMLPGMSGIEVCRALRHSPETKAVPILMVTARGEEIDRVVGFEVGADDYLVKPFSVRELMLRIRAILRRVSGTLAPVHGERCFGVLRLDQEAHRVWVEEGEVALTAMEFRLLNTFLERKGRVQSREVLLDQVWGINAYVQTRTVDVHVKRLREKLGEAGFYIETIRGVGYRFRDTPEFR